MSLPTHATQATSSLHLTIVAISAQTRDKRWREKGPRGSARSVTVRHTEAEKLSTEGEARRLLPVIFQLPARCRFFHEQGKQSHGANAKTTLHRVKVDNLAIPVDDTCLCGLSVVKSFAHTNVSNLVSINQRHAKRAKPRNIESNPRVSPNCELG